MEVLKKRKQDLKPFFEKAKTLLKESDRVVFDFRGNYGGFVSLLEPLSQIFPKTENYISLKKRTFNSPEIQALLKHQSNSTDIINSKENSATQYQKGKEKENSKKDRETVASEETFDLRTPQNFKKSIYVLINHGTASTAELATLWLSHFPNTKIIGQRSLGGVSYGGIVPLALLHSLITIHLPTAHFEVKLPEKFKGILSRFTLQKIEHQGIKPHVKTDNPLKALERLIKNEPGFSKKPKTTNSKKCGQLLVRKNR